MGLCLEEARVKDAKDRDCFHNAEEDDNLARAITASLVELGQLNLLQKKDSLLFKKARWKGLTKDLSLL